VTTVTGLEGKDFVVGLASDCAETEQKQIIIRLKLNKIRLPMSFDFIYFMK
jgi:hypothetical protein